jgi:hypothetical protein
MASVSHSERASLRHATKGLCADLLGVNTQLEQDAGSLALVFIHQGKQDVFRVDVTVTKRTS